MTTLITIGVVAVAILISLIAFFGVMFLIIMFGSEHDG